MYFALKGPNFNGNRFTEQALAAGAICCVVDEDADAENEKIIRVENALFALQELARHHREQLKIPVLAITGSNGKTTTKELIHAVLSKKFKCRTTIGNLNNHIGVPLTLLSIQQDDEFAVVEMGANHMHEIAGYCKYAQPNFGLITNCGKAHLEGFGSEENIKKGKGELFDYLAAHNGTAFINTTMPYLLKMGNEVHHTIKYGSATDDVYVTLNNATAQLSVTLHNTVIGKSIDVDTQLVGAYNLPNIAAAFVTGNFFGVPDKNIIDALSNYCPGNSRSQLMQVGTNQIILDAYNANPTSMLAAIENIAAMPVAKKVLMLGEMKELGTESIKEHAAIIHQISKYEWHSVLIVGENFKTVAGPYAWLLNSNQAAEWFKEKDFSHATILVKGSRGVAMENALK